MVSIRNFFKLTTSTLIIWGSFIIISISASLFILFTVRQYESQSNSFSLYHVEQVLHNPMHKLHETDECVSSTDFLNIYVKNKCVLFSQNYIKIEWNEDEKENQFCINCFEGCNELCSCFGKDHFRISRNSTLPSNKKKEFVFTYFFKDVENLNHLQMIHQHKANVCECLGQDSSQKIFCGDDGQVIRHIYYKSRNCRIENKKQSVKKENVQKNFNYIERQFAVSTCNKLFNL